MRNLAERPRIVVSATTFDSTFIDEMGFQKLLSEGLSTTRFTCVERRQKNVFETSGDVR